ncbi:MAG: SDR family oxidoreductase [Planctomycetes bacterium]|nr:SDR family oxidoreductase [Planctomycetota bacterium]
MDLQNRVALVTGGARRLGREFALALARAGMDVVVHHGHSEREARATCEEIRRLGRRATAVQADLADAAATERLVDQAAPDVLINNAAIFVRGTLRDTSLENWESHLAVNLRAPFLLMRAFARARGERPGKIVNLSDWRASHPGRAYLAYTVSKAGLTTLTQIAARELAPRIQVNALALGAVLPPAGGTEGDLERVLRRVPAGRIAEISEVTDALLALLRNDYITGETLFVDGGAHLR